MVLVVRGCFGRARGLQEYRELQSSGRAQGRAPCTRGQRVPRPAWLLH